ncbi:MAG: 4Fe-4S dicluster domain-containing protein [Candidatus Lindowbacteria bacterium]|nr:4Fe-4S dicluster domain-containing protein [Candidatus Lindowbacteria bacterium]
MKDLNKISRRKFLATAGFAGAAAVAPTGRSGAGVILKHLIPEEEIIPGVSYWPVSTCGECPAGCGVKVRIREGKAVKIEGNETHPVNLGGLCARGQSALQALYSPARIQTPLRRNTNGQMDAISWEDAFDHIARSKSASSSSGKVVLVTSQVTGAMRAMLERLAANSPRFSFFVSEPLDYAAMATANKLCFGLEAVPTYSFDKARTIVSFGADFLETWLSPVSYAHGYAGSRQLTNGTMGRMIQFESHLSLTGANADQRYCCPPGAETLIALSIASLMLTGRGASPPASRVEKQQLRHSGPSAGEESSSARLPASELETWRTALRPFTVERAAMASGIQPQIIEQVADRLRSETPSLAVAGGPTSRATYATPLQVAVNLINFIAGNYGKTLSFDRIENAPGGTYTQVRELVEDMEKGRVAALIVHDCNPAFAFPQPERLISAMKRAPLKIQLASAQMGASEANDLVLPTLHWLECWDELEPRSGIHSLRQPVVKSLYDARHPGQALSDIAAALSGRTAETAASYEEFLRNRWEKIREQAPAYESFDDFWQQVLTGGGYWAKPVPQKVTLSVNAAEAIKDVEPIVPRPSELLLLPIATVRYGDGRQTGRPWLHELPDPITTIVWDNPILISPNAAKKWNCQSGDIVKLKCSKGSLEALVYVQAGTSDAVVAAPLGAPSEKYAAYHFGVESHPLHRLEGGVDKASGALSWLDTPLTFEGVTARARFARLQGSGRENGRGIAQSIALNEVGRLTTGHGKQPAAYEFDLYPKHVHPLHDWTMVIDLSACIGCGACAVACYAENNVHVVGKKECLRGREQSWLRIEPFVDKGRIVFLPMLCQQCEHAPCETVCPVYAALHSSEGLNLQVYNRCVGTRYCANNCPYKVRRFNWFTYKVDPPLEKQFNPDVFVRTRGMMEKCTFCIQRIREHKEIAKDEKRVLRDGEVIPACAQSCPTGAIYFGDLKDPASRVSQQVGDTRGYAILSELNTQPSIIYLKRVYHPDGTTIERSPYEIVP